MESTVFHRRQVYILVHKCYKPIKTVRLYENTAKIYLHPVIHILQQK